MTVSFELFLMNAIANYFMKARSCTIWMVGIKSIRKATRPFSTYCLLRFQDILAFKRISFILFAIYSIKGSFVIVEVVIYNKTLEDVCKQHTSDSTKD